MHNTGCADDTGCVSVSSTSVAMTVRFATAPVSSWVNTTPGWTGSTAGIRREAAGHRHGRPRRAEDADDLADGSAGQDNGHAWEIEEDLRLRSICSAGVGRAGLYLEVIPAKEGQGLEFPYLPDEVVGDLCRIPDIDLPIPVEGGGRVGRHLPDDHVGHLCNVADIDDTVAVEITLDACDGDVARPGERIRAARGADREVDGVVTRGSVGVGRVLLGGGRAVAEGPEPCGRVAG